MRIKLLLPLWLLLCFSTYTAAVFAQTTTNQAGDGYYLKGKEQFTQGDYANALENMKNALPLLTNYDYLISAHRTLAVIYVAFSQNSEAVGEFKELLKLAPETILDPLTESPRVIEAFEEARKVLIEQGVLSPKVVAPPPIETPKAAPLKVEEPAKQPEPVAVETPKQAPVTIPPFVPATVREEKPKAAAVAPVSPTTIPKTEQLAVQPSTDTKKREFLKKAREFYSQKKYLQAAEQLEKALYEDPEYLEGHILLAKVYKRIEGKHLMAIDELKKVFVRQPDYVEAHVLLADIYINRTLEYEKGLAELKGVLIQYPKHAPAHNLMGLAYFKTRQFEKAIGEYQLALASKPNLYSAYNYLGDTYFQLQRWADAILEYEAAVSFSPTNLYLLADLAITYEKAGQPQAAVRTWNSFLQSSSSPIQTTIARQHLEKLNKALAESN